MDVKKSLKGKSEAINLRRDNTKPTQKKNNNKTMIYKTLHRNSRIEQQDSHKKPWDNRRCPGRVYILPFSYHYFNYIRIVNQLLLVTFFSV